MIGKEFASNWKRIKDSNLHKNGFEFNSVNCNYDSID